MEFIHSSFLKYCFFYASYAVFPFIAWQLWLLFRLRAKRKILPIFLLLLSSLFVWMRFIEPQMVYVRTTTIPHTGMETRIALISDLHIGLYKDPLFLERVVTHINQLDVDTVLIAGDLTYYPTDPLVEMFSSLKALQFPTYAVLGNHDQQRPGPNIDAELRAALADLNVKVIESQVVDAGPYLIAGLGDRWAKKDDPHVINQGKFTKPVLALMHHPNSSLALDARKVAVAFAGHTHCGQINLPAFLNYFSTEENRLYCGLEKAQATHGDLPVFISSGVGESVLPLRLFNPPTIEYIHITQ